MTIDGRALAESVYARLGTSLSGKQLGLLIIGSDTVTDSFIRTKARAAERLGVVIVRAELPEAATTDDALVALAKLAMDTDGVIVQLPLPKGIDTEAILAAIPPRKDVDGISAAPLVRPPVAEAILEILTQEAVQVHDAEVVIVGSGRLVGTPAAAMLHEMGARVTVLSRGDSLEILKNADIVILGAGEPGLVKPEHLEDGVVLIDAGTSESSGKIAGDAEPACAEKASLFTPVPGGVGPIAVAMIFKNLSLLSARSG